MKAHACHLTPEDIRKVRMRRHSEEICACGAAPYISALKRRSFTARLGKSSNSVRRQMACAAWRCPWSGQHKGNGRRQVAAKPAAPVPPTRRVGNFLHISHGVFTCRRVIWPTSLVVNHYNGASGQSRPRPSPVSSCFGRHPPNRFGH